MNLDSRDSVAVARAHGSYGVAETYDISSPFSPDLSVDLGVRFRFLAAEITGLWFVLLSAVYIFAIPAAVLRAGKLTVMMNQAIKRVMDIIGALVGLTLSLPFLIVLPILIRLDSPGPVFYTQTRVGVNRRRGSRRYCQKAGIAEDNRVRERRRADYFGQPFKVIKFRTMVHDAEKKSGPVWATQNDPRITRIGAFMRKTRLDEIPQFINVLKGEMSLVGPRPERPHFVEDLSTKVAGYTDRLEVKPGITGLAQVENGYDSSVASVAEKVKYDLDYISNWSLWTDIKILLKTVVVVFTGRGAC
jgi:lipopolysaccharide/colanic/teichoic acid biosynthesis glycosyltransferase